jgi:hypothetical protein
VVRRLRRCLDGDGALLPGGARARLPVRPPAGPIRAAATANSRACSTPGQSHTVRSSSRRHARRPRTTACTRVSGLLLRALDRVPKPVRIGVVGLGAGTLATYGRPGDWYQFYEINPEVIDIARTQFSFLRESRAHVTVVPGDARLSLEREPDQHFNVLVIDAFTGDSIPIQLLTAQAFRLYFRHLTPRGTLAVNISSRYLNLAPVVAREASALGKNAALIASRGRGLQDLTGAADWVLITADSSSLGARCASEALRSTAPTARGSGQTTTRTCWAPSNRATAGRPRT